MKYHALDGSELQVVRTDFGDQQFTCPACLAVASLDQEHVITLDHEGWISVSPSIICPGCEWHGHIVAGFAV